MFADYFSPFPSLCNLLIIEYGCLFTVGNDGHQCSVGKNTIVSETGDESTTDSYNDFTLYSVSFSNQSVTQADFVVSIDSVELIADDKMSTKVATAKGLVAASESKIPVELENGKVWQPSTKA